MSRLVGAEHAPTEDPLVERERDLVVRARSGDGKAFEELVAPHLALMYRVASRAARNTALAEEAVQESLTLVYRHLGRYRPGTSFKAYLAATAVKRARTLLRGERRRRLREAAADGRSSPDAPAELVSAAEIARRIRDALASLPPKRQRVVMLRLDAGLDYSEIAEAVGTTEGSARVLMHLALRDLAALLEDLVPEGARVGRKGR
jgi:RNA polymerase sigma-70 factor (ECF subfamily)